MHLDHLKEVFRTLPTYSFQFCSYSTSNEQLKCELHWEDCYMEVEDKHLKSAKTSILNEDEGGSCEERKERYITKWG